VKPSQLTQFLATSIQHRAPVLITGAPGIGKSDVVAQAAATVGAELIIEHPVVSDPTDFKGLPFEVDGKAEFLPFGSLSRIISATDPTVFFLDDLGQAPMAVQAACMQLLLARRINGHHVSDMVTFVAATNRRTDRAGVTGLLEPVKSRFATIVNLDVDMEDWVKWALAHDMPTELIAFIRFRPGLLHDFQPSADLVNSPSPRTVANVGKLMQMSLPRELEYEVYAGAAGEGFAAEFCGFLKIFRNLPNPDLILLSPDAAEVPTDPATLYALCGALSRKASEQTIDRLVRYYNRLPAEFSVLAVRDSVQCCPAIVNSRAFVSWASDHAEVLL
jgi:hypothetical protein